MSHESGNVVPEITREEHDHDQYAKRVSLVSAATIYAVVNTSGGGGGTTTVFQGGAPWSDTIVGNITISGAISLVSGYPITGIVTVANPQTSVSITGTPNVAVVGNISISGAVSLTSGYPITGIVTIANSPNVVPIGNVTINPSLNWLGFATVAIGSGGAGFQTVFQGAAPWSNSIVGNVTLSDPKGFIGLVTVGNLISVSTLFAVVNTGGAGTGFQTVFQGGAPWSDTITGNVTVQATTSFFHQLVSAASAQIVQFPGVSARWCIIQGDPLNTTNAFIGASGVSANVGFPLQPGQMTGSEITNLNQMWLANATGTSVNVRVMGGS